MHHLRRAAAVATVVVVSLALAAPVIAATRTVTMRDNAYQPATVTVRAGDAVSWVNGGQAPHDAQANDGSWSIGLLTAGERAAVRFTRPGTWRYHSSIHPEMLGTIVVRSAGATIPPTDTLVDDAAALAPAWPWPSLALVALVGMAGFATGFRRAGR